MQVFNELGNEPVSLFISLGLGLKERRLSPIKSKRKRVIQKPIHLWVLRFSAFGLMPMAKNVVHLLPIGTKRETKCTRNLLPHFFPACLFLMLHRFGMPMAIPGMIPACFANGDSKIAQRHFGEALSKAPTLAQQAGGTLALAFLAAPKHGLKLAAADLMGVLPHSPAASTSLTNTSELIRNTNKPTRQ